MNIRRPILPRAEVKMKRVSSWSELPPSQACFSAALRRAFDAPQDNSPREFDELLKKLA
jgi:hypothetical protein